MPRFCNSLSFSFAFLFLLIALALPQAHAAEVIGATCPTLGLTTMAADQQNLIACMKDKKGALIWKSMTGGNDGVPAGTLSFFALAACPSGWTLANGANGTLDVRGEFLRAWDAGRGLDGGRSLGSVQGDAIRNITGSFAYDSAVIGYSGAFSIYSHHDGGQSGNYGTGGVSFDASRVVPTANENRPRNIALLACQKLP